MLALFALFIGALITLMNGLNSRFSGYVGSLVSALVIHAVGLVAVSLVLLLRKEGGPRARLPPWYYLGGLVGVGTVFACNFAFAALGASLAVSLALLGQALFSAIVDATGFLGKRKYPFSLRSLPGLALALVGVGIMAGNWRADALAMLVALVSGALPILSISINSELGRRTGVFRGARMNFLVGLATTLVLAAILRPSPAAAVSGLSAAGPLLSLAGGVLGLVVVAATNSIFPRIPAFTAALLMFAGQALMGLLIDAARAGAFETNKFAGTLLVLLGLGLKTALDGAERRPPHLPPASPTPHRGPPGSKKDAAELKARCLGPVELEQGPPHLLYFREEAACRYASPRRDAKESTQGKDGAR